MTESHDQQIEWFHGLAAKPANDLARELTAELRSAVEAFVSSALPSHEMPSDLSAYEFAEHVHILRQNERSWNHALMSALIRAGDLFQSGNAAEAGNTLDVFASQCPWALFQQVARNQQSHYK